MAVQIVHGINLSEQKPTKQPKRVYSNLSITARVKAPLFNEVDKIARARGVTQSDIVRSAVMEFVRKLREAENVDGNQIPHTDPPAVPAIAQPRIAARYTGDGDCDHRELMQVNQRQADRKAREGQGERLVDKATAR